MQLMKRLIKGIFITAVYWEMRIQLCVNGLTEFLLKSELNMLTKGIGSSIWQPICPSAFMLFLKVPEIFQLQLWWSPPIFILLNYMSENVGKRTPNLLPAIYFRKSCNRQSRIIDSRLVPWRWLDLLELIGGWSQRNYKVRLTDRWCDCGYFQALHYLCRHVLTVCAYTQLDWASYVDDVYCM